MKESYRSQAYSCAVVDLLLLLLRQQFRRLLGQVIEVGIYLAYFEDQSMHLFDLGWQLLREMLEEVG